MICVLVLIFVLLIVYIKYRIKCKLEQGTFELNPEIETKILEADRLGMRRLSFYSKRKLIFAQWAFHGVDSPSVFIVHGNGESLSDWVDTQGLLLSLGYNSFVFDYAGFGSSEGKPTVNTLKQNTLDAWDCFCSYSSATNNRLIVAHSLGVAVLLHSISKLKINPDRIILHGAFSSARAMITLLGKINSKWIWLVPDVWNNVKNIHKIGTIKTVLVHSKSDKKLPYAMSQIIAKSNQQVIFKTLEHYGHNAVYENPVKEFWLKLLSQ